MVILILFIKLGMPWKYVNLCSKLAIECHDQSEPTVSICMNVNLIVHKSVYINIHRGIHMNIYKGLNYLYAFS